MLLIALGANLPHEGGTALDTCRWAATRLDCIPGVRLRALSRWYRTAPVPPSGQPDYINAVAHLTGSITPEALLQVLQVIEAEAGRQRSVPNAARTLDLDIVAMDQIIRDAPDPVLPHPRAHQRGFVLRPLADVAPDWFHPRLRRPLSALLNQLDLAGVVPLTG
jgi:2-amino-4-hydroxy-6-hydroxymethyldihydropteridine diphosphokinase